MGAGARVLYPFAGNARSLHSGKVGSIESRVSSPGVPMARRKSRALTALTIGRRGASIPTDRWWKVARIVMPIQGVSPNGDPRNGRA